MPVLYCTCPSSNGDAPKVWRKASLPIVPQLVGQASKILPQIVALFYLLIVPQLVEQLLDTENKADRISLRNIYWFEKALWRWDFCAVNLQKDS